jgi:hypothetical protein
MRIKTLMIFMMIRIDHHKVKKNDRMQKKKCSRTY